ncbi:MAG TPA: proton-conducting transporter membrane subunit [Stellaceae bacterium]|nr:proton-conducting transporter membrane subunit [Stellaceae bacterium]
MIAAGPLLAIFAALCAAGVVAALIGPERWNPRLVGLVGSLAALPVLAAGASLLLADNAWRVELWPLLSLGTLSLRADRLAGLFLVVAGLVFLPVSIFSAAYLPKYFGQYSLRYFSVLYYAVFGSVVLVLIAGDTISFLSAWEAMTIAAYLLVNYEHERDESSQAGFVMLAMSEGGTIAVAIALILVAGAAGTFDFPAIAAAPPALTAAAGWAVFLLSFFGFAVKAGLVPVGAWLPLAHPVAPTNVSALLSAVIVNLGIYGIIRVNLDLAPITGAVPGLIVLVVGSLSALIGILYATTQAEMKRLLAHSTIENMGIVAAGIGAAMTFMATGHPIVAAIALIAALYHLANHSVYKALLFVGTGAVEAATGTRDLDRLGGIIRRMPWTSALFLVGVLGISALPPLNGFVSEWLTLQTILRSAVIASTPIKIVFALAGALLALTAGLAVTCFAKVFAMGFLGLARSEGAARAGEALAAARVSLGFLAASCIALGLLPTYVIPLIDRVAAPLAHQSAAAALVPPFFGPPTEQQSLPPAFLGEFHDLGAQVGGEAMPGRGLVVLHRGGERNPVVFAMSTAYTVVVLAVMLAVIFVVFGVLTRRRVVTRKPVWAGGLRRLTPGITYTATGFSNPVRVIFQAIVCPVATEDSTEAVARHFRTAIRREHAEVHIVDRLVLEPPVRALGWLAAIVRRMHVGHVNAYAAYVLLAMVAVLVFGVALQSPMR